MINKLTGEPVSEEMQSVLKRLAANESVPEAEIMALKEIKEANSCISSSKPTIELKNKSYHKDFNPKFTDVLDWAFAHRDIVWNTPFAEQEKMMIADGVLTESDIIEVA